MNGRRSRHQSGNKPGKWIAVLAVPLFLLGTGLFSFLWNVPLNTLRAAHSATAPPAILIRKASSPENHPIALDSSFLAGIQPFLEHYAGSVSNAGRLDFTTHDPQEVEIRDGRALHRPEPFPGDFQFPHQVRVQHADEQKTGRCRPGGLPVAEKHDATGRAGGIGGTLTQASNGTGSALSNPSSSRKSCGTAGSSAKGATASAPEDDPIQRL